MMRKVLMIAGLSVATILASCSNDDPALEGEGRVSLHTTVNSDVKVVSRAATADELGAQCTVWISGTKGLVRKYQGISNVPSEIWLASGEYVAEAWTGDSVAASFDSRYFKGYQPFTVESGKSVNVELVCKIANVVSSVSYADGVDDVLSDYTMTVSNSKGELVFNGRDDRKGYFMMPQGETSLTWTLAGTQADGSQFTRSGKIENVKPATEYRLNVAYNGSDIAMGGGMLTIEVDETAIEVEDEIIITTAPKISGVGFDLANGISGESGKIGSKSIALSASSSLKSVTMTCDKASSIGYPSAGADLVGMDDATRNELSTLGITATYAYDSDADVSTLSIDFADTFTNSLADGIYVFTITAIDGNDKQRSVDFKITVSDAVVSANDIVPADVWASKATLKGTVLNNTVNEVGFNYRLQGSSDWTYVAGVKSGTAFSAAISNLTPGKTYEYAAVADGKATATIKTFSTEAAAQIPNGGFEDWNTSSTAYLLCSDASNMFWDSGNHGSTTLGKNYNITLPEGTVKHSGNYSAKLASRNIIIKFAAGNAFTGKYLDTNGTDGVLGFGRPFASRPKALHGYVKYTSASVQYAPNSKFLDELPKGSNDIGTIYVAICDGTTEEYNGESYPFIVKTKSSERRLFDKNDARVIAYGEATWNASTEGDGLIEFTIPIDYKRTDVKAENIIVVCSASKYGDYYTGGASVMYVDDLELVYE